MTPRQPVVAAANIKDGVIVSLPVGAVEERLTQHSGTGRFLNQAIGIARLHAACLCAWRQRHATSTRAPDLLHELADQHVRARVAARSTQSGHCDAASNLVRGCIRTPLLRKLCHRSVV